MHPTLAQGVSIWDVQDEKDGKRYFYVENCDGQVFEITSRLYQELCRANGANTLRITRRLRDQLRQKKIITTSRFIFRGVWNQLILFPVGEKLKRYQDLCHTINRAMPMAAAIALPAALFCMHFLIPEGGENTNLAVLLILNFFSLFAHEAGHIISGVAYGYKIWNIGLLLFGIIPMGAYVSLADRQEQPRLEKSQLCLAGIEVNLILAGLFGWASVGLPGCSWTFYIAAQWNLLMAVINILPVDGLDGGAFLCATLNVEDIDKKARRFLSGKKYWTQVLQEGTRGYIYAAIFVLNGFANLAFRLLIAFLVLNTFADF